MLTTAVPGVLLPTVRSRCMRLRLGRLTESEVAEILARDHELSPSDARAAAALADGSVSNALDLGSSDLIVLRELGMQLLARAASGAAAARLQAATPLVTLGPKKDRDRGEVKLALRLVASMLRDIELLNAGGDATLMANAVLADELRVTGAPGTAAIVREPRLRWWTVRLPRWSGMPGPRSSPIGSRCSCKGPRFPVHGPRSAVAGYVQDK